MLLLNCSHRHNPCRSALHANVYGFVLMELSGWGGVVRKERKKERQSALEMAAGDIVDQPLLNVGNRLVRLGIIYSSCCVRTIRINVVVVF